MAARGSKKVHQSENLSKCSGQKSTCRFFGAGTCSAESTCQFFPLGRMLVTPSDARRRCKNDAKGYQKQQTRGFLLCAKNSSFHWFKRTWAPKDALQSQQLGAKNFKKECQGNKMEHKGANMSQKAPKKDNLGNKIELKGPKMETR